MWIYNSGKKLGNYFGIWVIKIFFRISLAAADLQRSRRTRRAPVIRFTDHANWLSPRWTISSRAEPLTEFRQTRIFECEARLRPNEISGRRLTIVNSFWCTSTHIFMGAGLIARKIQEWNLIKSKFYFIIGLAVIAFFSKFTTDIIDL